MPSTVCRCRKPPFTAMPRAIAAKSKIPVVADTQNQPRYVFAAIEAGCAKVRVNPGNIKAFDDKIADIARAATEHGTSIRIGIRRNRRRRRSGACGSDSMGMGLVKRP